MRPAAMFVDGERQDGGIIVGRILHPVAMVRVHVHIGDTSDAVVLQSQDRQHGIVEVTKPEARSGRP